MILTIDLDIIMEPSINLYNDKINGKSRFQTWNNLQKELDLNRHLFINKETWNWIVELIIQASKKNIPHIIYSDNHCNILYGIDYFYRHYKKHIGRDTIINVDHHHDLGYGNYIIQLQKNDINCANWAGYLLEKNYVNNYYWIHNKNSEMPDENYPYLYMEDIFSKDIDIEKLLINCDAIFFAGSSNWIPPKYNLYIISLQSLLCKYFSIEQLIFLNTDSLINSQFLSMFNQNIKGNNFYGK